MLARPCSSRGQETAETSTSDDASQEAKPTRSDSQTEAANKVKGSFKRPASWMIVFGSALAISAGIVNVSCILHLGTVVSHMTGIATNIGLHLEGVRIGNRTSYELLINNTLIDNDRAQHLDFLWEKIWLMVSFTFGAFLCGLVVPKNALHFGGDSFYGVALMGNSVLLILTFYLAQDDEDDNRIAWAACCAAMASGLQNAMCSMHLGAVVRTTHVTGTVTDIGSTAGRVSAIMLKRLFKGGGFTYLERVELGVDWSKLKVLNTVFFSFVLGCYLGAWLYSHFILYTFLVPAAITGIAGIGYACFSGLMAKQIEKMQAAKLAEDVEEIEDILQRADSFMRERRTPTNRSQEMHELTDQVEHALDVLHHLENRLHEVYGDGTDEETQPVMQPTISSRGSSRGRSE